MIKYLGSKRTFIPVLRDIVQRVTPPGGVVIDLFSGTSRVGHAMKCAGFAVRANDHNTYAATLARCYVQADAEDHLGGAEALIEELNRLPGRPGYFTKTFCEDARFFHPKNGERVDAIRERIASMGLEPEREAVVLTALMEAADRVDSTVGVQMAYLKQWAPRAHQDLRLRVPALLPRPAGGKSEAHQLDAVLAAEALKGDTVYLDPPYNQHKYLGNYHIWESLVLWDKPDVYGVANKRVDCQMRKSSFNSRREAGGAMAQVVAATQARNIILSFSDEGFLGRAEIEAILSSRGEVAVIEMVGRRYVGAQIGVHNLKGERVGVVGATHNKERIYVAGDMVEKVRVIFGEGV